MDARYSEHYKITKEELEWLLIEVEKLKEKVRKLSEAHIKTLMS